MSWNFFKWLLFGVWVAAAAANMAQIRGGFLTNHAADLTIPAWLYIVLREQASTAKESRLMPWAGRSAEITAGLVFAGSTVSEIAQLIWPRGPFPGTFDPLDLAAYCVSAGACYLADRRWPLVGQPRA